MNFLYLQSAPHPLPPRISCFHKTTRKLPILKPVSAIPARDRVIDFGKHKGKMLGTLPSTYLKWVSKNLRARDFEEWAKLADEVLEDPVYRDRIEWEFAQKVLNGDVPSSSLLSSRTQQHAVSELLDFSERFGWDNEDKVGWAKIDFGLLGTSKGGRIPRRSSTGPRPNKDAMHVVLPNLGDIHSREDERKNVPNRGGGERRRERMERGKMRRKSSIENGKKSGIRYNKKGSFGNSSNIGLEANERVDEDRVVEFKNPFPGRESLIKKVLKYRRC